VSRIVPVALVVTFALAAAGPGLGAQPLPLSARVIAHGELPGFGPFGGPADLQTFKAPAPFLAAYQQRATPSQRASWVALLRREGFVAVAVEQLGSLTPNRGGLSWAMELGSAAGARGELANEVRNDESHGPVSRFVPAGIPSAAGFRLGSSSSGGDNVLFSDGRFLYFVGIGWGGGGKPARAALVAAAQKLYRRVHGRTTT
jgi:hypothetical protein